MEKLNLDVPSVEMDLVDSGLLDSLIFVDLLLHLQREFELQIDISALDLDRLRSISSIAELVAGYGSDREVRQSRSGVVNG